MSKMNNDGDVLANKISLGLAKHQKLQASWTTSQPEAQPANETSKIEDEDSEVKQEFFGHDRLGVGGILPKNVAGNFNKRTLTTSDKLLEQLIGKKKAKAHLAAKQQAERSGAQPPPKHGRRDVPKKEESDDEEEGRAATFKSKRRKVAKPTQAPVSDEEDRPEEDAPETTVPDEPSKDAEQHEKPKEDVPSENNNETNEPVPAAPKPRSIPSRGRAKPTSYLDELLAERSKKKKNKIKNMGTGEN